MNPLLAETLVMDVQWNGTPNEALDWIVSEKALPALPFLQNVTLENGLLAGELRVKVPLFGEVALPFVCRTERHEHHAELHSATPADWLEQQRAWLELNGEARPSTKGLKVQLQFLAFIRWPASQTVGDAAFSKMANKTAERTLLRVTSSLPDALQAAASTAAATPH